MNMRPEAWLPYLPHKLKRRNRVKYWQVLNSKFKISNEAISLMTRDISGNQKRQITSISTLESDSNDQSCIPSVNTVLASAWCIPPVNTVLASAWRIPPVNTVLASAWRTPPVNTVPHGGQIENLRVCTCSMGGGAQGSVPNPPCRAV